MPELSPLKDITLVSVFDPAIDISLSTKGAMLLDQYARERDIEIVRPLFSPVRTPMLWTFAPLTGLAKSLVDSLAPSPKVQRTRAFQAAFRKVEGIDLGGRPWEPELAKGETDGEKMLHDRSLRALEGFGLAKLIDEFGRVVYERTQLTPFDSAHYSAPPGFEDDLATRLTAIERSQPSEQN